MVKTSAVSVVVMAVLITSQAWAQAQQKQDSRLERTQIEHSEQDAADAWGLSSKEYDRYQAIMEGPRGTWSPNLDPLTALGLEARSEAERRKYAEKLVETERQRVETELAFQRAYDAAWQQLYPNDMPVESFTTKDDKNATQSVFGSTSAASSQRVNVVVATQGCDQCIATVKRLMSSGTAMDIWFVDSNGEDDRIRRWASKVGIPPEQVRAGNITLNHGGTLDVDTSELPRVAPRG